MQSNVQYNPIFLSRRKSHRMSEMSFNIRPVECTIAKMQENSKHATFYNALGDLYQRFNSFIIFPTSLVRTPVSCIHCASVFETNVHYALCGWYECVIRKKNQVHKWPDANIRV